jgi:hypothetical protein
MNFIYKFLLKVSTFLENIFSPIIMSIVFYILFVPLGILLQLVKKDLLNLRYDKTKKSYWIKGISKNPPQKLISTDPIK